MQIEIDEFALRLKEERERLGLSQHDFAQLGGVNRITQMRYETKVNFPSVDYLCLLGQNGIDTLYILYGQRGSQMVETSNPAGLIHAMQWVDDIMAQHNYQPTVELRGRAIFNVYRQICRFGSKKGKPTLEDLIQMKDEIPQA